MKAVMHLKAPVSFLKEGKTYIAYSPVLDLSTSAASFKKAQDRFSEVAKIFFEELVEMGTMDEVLTNLGWKKVQSRWSAPIPVSHELADISIPLQN